MTESTQLQTAENSNASVVKMEPPTPATSTALTSALGSASPASTSSAMAAAAAAAAAAASLAAAGGSNNNNNSSLHQAASALAAAAAASSSSPASSSLMLDQLSLPSLPTLPSLPPPSLGGGGGVGAQYPSLPLPLTHMLPQHHQQQYALKWNDFQSSILTSFRHLRDEEDFVDVTLACDQRSFTAHKVVLSACSPYFRKLLKANPCEHPIVILRDVRSDDVDNLLSFMYNGEVNVTHENLPDFLKTAHLLQIRGLADVTGSYAAALNATTTALAASLSNCANNSNNNNNGNGNNITNINNNSIGSHNLNKLHFPMTPHSSALGLNIGGGLGSGLGSGSSCSNSMNNNNNHCGGGSLSPNNPHSAAASPFCIPSLAAAAVAATGLPGAGGLLATAGSNNNCSGSGSNAGPSGCLGGLGGPNNSGLLLAGGGNSLSNNNNNISLNSSSTSCSSNSAIAAATPAIQELKASATTAAAAVAAAAASPSNHQWDLSDVENAHNSSHHLTPPPQKRIKSADLFRAQHGISPERLLIDERFPTVAGQHPLTRERRNKDPAARDAAAATATTMAMTTTTRSSDSLLGQALEAQNNSSNGQVSARNKAAELASSRELDQHRLLLQKSHGDLASLHAQSAGEDSNSSDTEPSDRGDGTMDSLNGSLDNQRLALFGLQGIPGLLPGPSGIAGDFVSRRALEMRVRATDPRPCPKCGKIYRSAHTLRTHLEDKHTVCPGYRCVLCGTVAKSRNSLHSHMSRQHRGISTKDLPVLPMPSPFDPDLASRLLAKAGVKISPAELRARASPTSGSGSGGGKHDMNSSLGGVGVDEIEDSDDDPEDLTTGSGVYGGLGGLALSAANLGGGVSGPGGLNVGGGAGAGASNDFSRYHESLLSNFGHANSTISRIRNEAAAVAAAAALGQQKDLAAGGGSGGIPTSSAAGQSLLDTYLQFITENTFAGMGMSQEHAAAAALHAAKMAQLNAMGHGLDKLPAGLLPPHFDLAKLAAGGGNFVNAGNALSIDAVNRLGHDGACAPSPNENGPNDVSAMAMERAGLSAGLGSSTNSSGADIGRESSEPMDLGLDQNQSGSNNVDGSASGGIDGGANSDGDDNYSEDEGVHNT